MNSLIVSSILSTEFTVENVKKHLIYRNNQFYYDKNWFVKTLSNEITIILINAKVQSKNGFNLLNYISDIISIKKNFSKILVNLKYRKLFEDFLTNKVNKKIDEISLKLKEYTSEEDNEIVIGALISMQTQLIDELTSLKKSYYNEYSSIN